MADAITHVAITHRETAFHFESSFVIMTNRPK
jgi:hypothetical protein